MEYLGWIAVVLFTIGGLQRNPRKTLLFCLAGNTLFIAKYYLQAHYSPFTLMLCNTSCALMLLVFAEKYRIYLGSTSFLISSYFIVSNFSSSFDFLILLAAFFIAWSQVNLSSYIKYKMGVMASQALWIVFSYTISDYAMIATCLFILASNSYSLLINIDKDIEEGTFVLTPSTAPYLTPVLNIAKITKKTIINTKMQLNAMILK